MLMASNRTKEILIGLLKAGGIITITLLAPGASPLLDHFVNNKKLDKRSLNRTLKRLEDSKLVTAKSKNGRITITLEVTGKQRAVEYELGRMTIPTPKKWDKKWRIVAFDIPEKKRAARRALKTKLDQLGFVQLQESIYVYPYPCEKEVRYLCSIYEVNDYIKFVLAEQIDGQDNLQRIYKLVPK
jgi:CRISPR-associated endonuclease Cas2